MMCMTTASFFPHSVQFIFLFTAHNLFSLRSSRFDFICFAFAKIKFSEKSQMESTKKPLIWHDEREKTPRLNQEKNEKKKRLRKLALQNRNGEEVWVFTVIHWQIFTEIVYASFHSLDTHFFRLAFASLLLLVEEFSASSREQKRKKVDTWREVHAVRWRWALIDKWLLVPCKNIRLKSHTRSTCKWCIEINEFHESPHH